MSQTWKEKRELLLSLGTHQYQKPTQLPMCEAVCDSTINRLPNAENLVKPVGRFIYVNSERLLYINGLPSVQKGF